MNFSSMGDGWHFHVARGLMDNVIKNLAGEHFSRHHLCTYIHFCEIAESI